MATPPQCPAAQSTPTPVQELKKQWNRTSLLPLTSCLFRVSLPLRFPATCQLLNHFSQLFEQLLNNNLLHLNLGLVPCSVLPMQNSSVLKLMFEHLLCNRRCNSDTKGRGHEQNNVNKLLALKELIFLGWKGNRQKQIDTSYVRRSQQSKKNKTQ